MELTYVELIRGAFFADRWKITDWFKILAIGTRIIGHIYAPVWSGITRHLPIHYPRSHLD